MERDQRKRILLHMLFWGVNMGMFFVTSLSLGQKPDLLDFFLPFLSRWGIIIAVVYTNLYVLIPNFLVKGRYGRYALGFVGLFATYLLLQAGSEALFAKYINHEPFTLWELLYSNSIAGFLYLILTTSLKFTLDWRRQHRRAQQLEVQNLKNELELLKSQVNPHFLFNSLNSIYGHIDRRNEFARKLVLQFSEMLRYQLYECNGDTVSLTKEIAYLENYIQLQRTRKEDNLVLDLKIESLPSLQIAPMLFIPFIENAFKFVSSHEQEKNYIFISLHYRNGALHFTCINTMEPHKTGEMNGAGGIGINNAKRRLELLYPGKHELKITEADHVFSVNLHIDYEPA